MGAIFRPYSDTDSIQSDRSSSDRLRHREKVRESIRENIADIVAEESIIGREGDTIIKVPIRGIKEYRFVYGENSPGVGQGDGETQEGDVVGKTSDKKERGVGSGGNEPGTDYYETDVTIEEIIELMFDDLELPDLERKTLRQTISQRSTKRKGYRKQGIRVHLDKKRTVKSRIKRKLARERSEEREIKEKENETTSFSAADAKAEHFPFRYEDMRYRRRQPDISYDSNAVVICLMDTSGSMDNVKKYLARSFFFLLYQFVRSRYEAVDLLFIAHDTKAQEVGEDDFFYKGQSGGTMISSGYQKVLDIIEDRYHPSVWNIYCFHCSDGDNFTHDNNKAVKLAGELCEKCNLFGYGEIKPDGSPSWEGSIINRLEEIEAENFEILRIKKKEDVWSGFKSLLSKDKQKETA